MKVRTIRKYFGSLRNTIVVDSSTKKLVKRLKPYQIAVIKHTDLDEIAAQSLIEKKPSAVINFNHTLTGTYPSRAASRLLQASIPLFDVLDGERYFQELRDGMRVEIHVRKKQLYLPDSTLLISLEPITPSYIEEKLKIALMRFNRTFQDFANNSLWYAQLETEAFIKPFPKVPLQTHLYRRPVVVVARSAIAKEDMRFLIPYINQYRPCLIGVDGGADILMEYGFIPDIVVGDMDSVSDQALYRAKDRVVHSYPDGQAPGLEKLKQLNLNYHLLPYLGTSEDITLLMAFESGAEPIILVGSHTHMLDFLEKGRKGMGSTLLTRMKMGHVLIDVKGIHMIYPNSSKSQVRFSFLLLASFIPLISLLLASPGLRTLVYAIWVDIRTFFY